MSGTLALAAVALSLCTSAHSAPKYKVLHSFTGTDGSGPYGGVALDGKGNVYGTTAGGGSGNACTGGCGVVFQITHAHRQWTYTVLYNFLGGKGDGADPWSRLVFNTAGSIVGTTKGGGAYDSGTVFELSPGSGGWAESLPYTFGDQSGDARRPHGRPSYGQYGQSLRNGTIRRQHSL
jgi:hypothetical protein